MLKRISQYTTQYDMNLWVLSVGWFVGALGFAVSIPFIAIYFNSKLGLSLSQIGIFFGVLAIVRSVFQILGGEISDRMERRTLLIHSQIIRGFAFLMMAISIYYDWGFWAISFFLLLNSIFGAVFQPAANATVSDILPKEKRIEGFAITRSAGNLGWAVGPAIGGFMADLSYGHLFMLSSIITVLSGIVFWVFLKAPKRNIIEERFRFKDLIAVKDEKLLARHSLLIFMLYLVVAQLIAPFSVYTVNMAGITESELGFLYTINGLMVVLFQIPITHLMSKKRFTTQLIIGSFIYAIGYGMLGFWGGFTFFLFAMIVITFGEVFMSPPSLALTAALAPPNRMGRYMGIFGFFVASGWSFGPLYGGFILDHFGESPKMAWILISLMAVISGLGYLLFRKQIPYKFDIKKE